VLNLPPENKPWNVMRKLEKTMRKIVALIIILNLFSCNNTSKSEEIVNIEKTGIIKYDEKINPNLLYFDLELIADIDVDDKNEPELYQITNLKTKYVDDIIYVKGFVNTNACDNFKGNIEIKNNNLKLKITNISNEPCMSCSKFEVRFIIKNEKKKKYEIGHEVKYEINQETK
jgi:hypothetical protein